MSPRSWGRTPTPKVDVGAGEKVLAAATAIDGTVLAGTRDAFYSVTGGQTRRVPWEQVEAADWDRDTDTFRLSEVGSWGEQRPADDDGPAVRAYKAWDVLDTDTPYSATLETMSIDLAMAEWTFGAKLSLEVPPSFIRLPLHRVMWNYAVRTRRDVLPHRYREQSLYLRRVPRLPALKPAATAT